MFLSVNFLRLSAVLGLLALLAFSGQYPTLMAQTALAAKVAQAATASGASAKGSVTKVTSAAMVYDSEARKVTFSKQVKVVRPDFTLTSDKLELYLAESAAGAAGTGAAGQSGASLPGGEAMGMDAGKVETIVALGNVRIVLPENRLANCQKATYTVRNEVLRMDGGPVLVEEGNKLSADVIYFYMTDNRSEAQGNVKVDFESQNGK